MTVNRNIFHQKPAVSRLERERLNGHKSCILWFTGLSGAGKSTLARAVEEYLHQNKVRTYVLDGDNIRRGLCNDLGFSESDRHENIRRIGEVSNLLMQAGIVTLAAFISPFTKDRQVVRETVGEQDFIEIFCSASLDICEARDVKGLYKKARAGTITEFTGITSPYEKPVSPELVLDTGLLSVEECVQRIITCLKNRGILLV